VSFLAEDDDPRAARPQATAWSQRSQPQRQMWPDEDPAYYEPAYYEPAYPEPGYYQPAYREPSYQPAYYEPDYYEPGDYEPEYREPRYREPQYREPAPGGEAHGPDEYDQDQGPPPGYRDPGDDFPGQPEPDAYLDVADLRPPAPRLRDRPYPGGQRNRRRSTGPKRAAGIVVAAASVVGVALLAPSILTAAENETLTGVVIQSSLDTLNFAAAGRVGRVRVRLGQMVKKGQLLAREITPAGALSALRTDRAAIVADKTDLAALIAAGAPTASVTAAQAQLASDRAQQAADQAAMVIRAPVAGTVVAVFGRAGDSASPAGLPGPGQQPAATQLSALTLASLRGGGRELPVIALRTSSQLQVKLLIPAESPAALKVGSALTLAVPAAGLTRVTGVITDLAERPSSAGGGDVAVIQVRGTIPATALTGMRADVHLGS
jgi:multidrug efflux pump subunit AcrA (membrane-fusion protein)